MNRLQIGDLVYLKDDPWKEPGVVLKINNKKYNNINIKWFFINKIIWHNDDKLVKLK